MAANLLVPLAKLFQMISWEAVVRNGPDVVNVATKLLNIVARKRGLPPQPTAAPVVKEPSPHAEALSLVESRVTLIEGDVAELHSEVLSSSELLKSLAEQNAKLVQAVEFLRVRALLLSAAIVVLTLVAGAMLFFSVLK